jgi:hypothetical protein
MAHDLSFARAAAAAPARRRRSLRIHRGPGEGKPAPETQQAFEVRLACPIAAGVPVPGATRRSAGGYLQELVGTNQQK